MAESSFVDQRKFRPRLGAEVRYRSSDAVKAIAKISDILKCEERNSPLSVLEYDRYVIEHKLPFPNSSTVRALMVTWKNALIAANVNFERKKSSKAETGFTAEAIKKWVADFIRTTGKTPNRQDIELARKNKYLPEKPETVTEVCGSRLADLIKMYWAQHELGQLEK